jgi:alkylation response protein AidB-like acyl-CoA dehydrogenase
MTDTSPAAALPDEDDFRARVRAFLAGHAHRKGDTAHEGDHGDVDLVARTRAFQAALADAGLAGLTYPVAYGGQGLPRRYQELWTQEAAAFTLPTFAITISHGMCLPIMSDFATHERKLRHLERIIRAEEIWCQMFSEPGAGSDVASLQTRAERDGDGWVLNGQKVWTSGAQYCDFGLCLARTDPDLPKHDGLSMFIVDLRDPGVEIRPLRQMTGDADFNEVFLTDVRVPADALVGDLNRGWHVAVTMLMYERVALGAGGSGPMSAGRARPLIAAAQANGSAASPRVRQALADLYIRETVLRYIGLRTREAVKAGRAPGPEGSIAKLSSALLAVQAAEVASLVVGARAQAWTTGDDETPALVRGIVGSLAIGIAGGTNEVQRNIIGERVLGLPREPAVDKGVPYKDLLVGTQTRPAVIA